MSNGGTHRRVVWQGRVALAVVVVSFAALFVVSASSVQAAAGGPLVLMGIDGEDGGPDSHGPLNNYRDVVNSIITNVTNGGSGILAIGGGKSPTDDVTEFWDAIETATGVNVTYVNGAAISTQSFSGFAMLAVVTSDDEVSSGGLTDAENNFLIARRDDIAAFVNNGGGLFGFSQTGLTTPYGYIADLGSFTFDTGLVYDDITPTAEGTAIGITNALDVGFWHDDFKTWPSFLNVLAFNTDTGHDTHAAALGGQAVLLCPVGSSPTASPTLTPSPTQDFAPAQAAPSPTPTPTSTPTAVPSPSPTSGDGCDGAPRRGGGGGGGVFLSPTPSSTRTGGGAPGPGSNPTASPRSPLPSASASQSPAPESPRHRRRRLATAITIRFLAGGDGAKGSIESPRKRCTDFRKVVLKRVDRGADTRLASDVSNGSGNWLVHHDLDHGRFYALAKRKTFDAANGDPIVCLPDRSVTLRR